MSFYFQQTQQEEDGAVYGPKGGEECLLEGRGECETENGVFCNADMTDLNNDTADAESGVEPDSSDWIYQETNESVEFDITAEQAMATLQYFSESSYFIHTSEIILLTKTFIFRFSCSELGT